MCVCVCVRLCGSFREIVQADLVFMRKPRVYKEG